MLLADDVGVEVDIPAWCLSTGNDYLGIIKEDTAYRVFIRRN
jgi:TusA-related sulfurtransferase